MPETRVMSRSALFRELREQGFEVGEARNGWVVRSPDGQTKSVHRSLFTPGTGPGTWRKAMADLARIGFVDNVDNGANGQAKRKEEAPAVDVPTFDAGRHSMRYRVIPVADLKVDPGYQRGLNESHAKAIAEAFNELALDPLKVSEREDGSFYVVNGQHRWRALCIRGWDVAGRTVPCLVVTGLSRPEEAMLFDATNYVKALKAYDHYRSRLNWDPVAREMQRTCDEFGVEVVEAAGKFRGADANRTSAVKAIYDCTKAGVLPRVLTILRDAKGWGFEGSPWVLSSTYIKALTIMLTAPEWVALFDDANMVKKLGGFAPDEVMRIIGAKTESTIGMRLDKPKAAVQTLYSIYNNGLAPARQLPSGPELPGRKMKRF